MKTTVAHGGLLVLADPSCGLTPLQDFTIQGCGYQAFLWQAPDCTIVVTGLYMKTNETLQSDTNATILSKLLALIEATAHPFVLTKETGKTTLTAYPARSCLPSSTSAFWRQTTVSCQET